MATLKPFSPGTRWPGGRLPPEAALSPGHRAAPQNESRWLFMLGVSTLLHLGGLALLILFLVIQLRSPLSLKNQAIAAHGPAAPLSLQMMRTPQEVTAARAQALPVTRPQKSAARAQASRPVTSLQAHAAGDAAAFSHLAIGSRSFPAPPYPEEARFLGQTGTVYLKLSFAETGRVTQAKVIVSSGHRVLDENAADFILQHWGDPAQAGQVLTVPVAYRLTSLER